MLRRTLLLAALAAGLATADVTVRPHGGAKTPAPPDYERRLHFFVLGFFGGVKEVDVRALCGERPIEQIRLTRTVPDVVLSLATLGIYSPRTARAWCALPDGEAP